ncbi:MAG: zinc-dependent metalloprotease family protein [Myxococcota bacterium]
MLPYRPDLRLQTFTTPITNGATSFIDIDLPEGASSMLLEVRSSEGFFFVDQFFTPSGQELARTGQFLTREAREVSGLADFLFPNDDTFAPIPGRYRVSFSAFTDRAGNTPLPSGNADVRVYTVQRNVDETCGIYLDFLVDYQAIDQASFQEAIGLLVARVDAIYRQVGVAVIDYQIQQINLQSPDINVGTDTVLDVADDVLRQARTVGSARAGALHVMVVRSIEGESASGFNPAGYSMGLPGPYDADRPNATVLVSTDHYASVNADGALVLDVDGMATSLAHELGHFMGLYHPSEASGSGHDPLSETSECSTPSTCDDAFRQNIMTSSAWLTGAGLDPAVRMTLTSGQGRVIRRHPLCEPFVVEAIPEPTCELSCDPPETCALLSDGAGGRYEACIDACDPRAPTPCPTGGDCLSDLLGTNVCQ